jgi:hypothetical protein
MITFEEGKMMKMGWADIAIIATSLLILIGTAFTAETEFPWVVQDLAGIPGLFFSVASVIVGATLVGRLKRPQGVNLFRLHRKIGVFFAVLVVVTFIHGLWDRIAHGEQFFWQHTEPSVTVVHGWVGVIIMIMALSQVVPSLAVKDRRKTGKLHMILGYALLILLIIQIFLGIGTVLVETAGG